MNIRIALVFALAFAVNHSTRFGHAQELEKKVTVLAEPYLDSETVVGMSIGMIQNGKTVQVHLGHLSAGGPKPTSESIYEIGSISKVFTGILLGDAVTRGDVTLDQDAQDLLPEGVSMPKGKSRAISLLDLSIHRSGLPRLPDNFGTPNTENPYEKYTSKQAYEFLNAYKLTKEPGAKGEYSNFAASLLGHLLNRKAGMSYDDLLAARIANPLGMNDTRVEFNDSMRKRLATPYVASGVEAKNWDFADMPGAGGIRSSTTDMMKFAEACLNPPENETGKAIRLAWREHHPGGGGSPKMGLGWHFAGDGTRWHNGQTGGYHSMLLINRQLQIAVVLLTNTSTGEVDQLANQVIQLLAGGTPKPRKFDETKQVDTAKMKRLEGKYQLAPNFIFTVKVQGKKLMVGITNQPTLEVFAKSETEWFYKVVPASMKFKLGKNGKARSLVLNQNGAQQEAKRIK